MTPPLEGDTPQKTNYHTYTEEGIQTKGKYITSASYVTAHNVQLLNLCKLLVWKYILSVVTVVLTAVLLLMWHMPLLYGRPRWCAVKDA